MQNSLHEILAYILLRSEQILHRKGLSKYRITKLVYLCDWCYACACDKQITSIHWFFDNYGPFVWNITNTLTQDQNLFSSNIVLDPLGNKITSFSINCLDYKPNIEPSIQDCMEYVLQNAVGLPRQEFTNLVYATYPIKTSRRYTSLNLLEKAQEYKKMKKRSVI